MNSSISIQIDCAGLSDIGKVRRVNEDQFLIANLTRSMRIRQTSLELEDQGRIFGKAHGKLFAVADGLGGHESGEVASQLAIDGLLTWFLHSIDWLSESQQADIEEKLADAFHFAQSQIFNETELTPQRVGMGTTLTMAYVDWPTAYVVHVGDSRCYLLREDELRPITTDHNLASSLAALADLGEDDTKPPRHYQHILWNVVGGGEKSLQPELHRIELQANDALLLCTDGLTKYVSDDELKDLMLDSYSAKDVCRILTDMANRRGGNDNITVVVSRFVDSTVKHAGRTCGSVSEAKPN
jgi:protein phosphatase